MKRVLGNFQPHLILIFTSVILVLVVSLSTLLLPANFPKKVYRFIEPAAAKSIPSSDIIPKPKPVNCAKVACLSLTFDDGPDSITTPQILSVLEKNHVNATFFVVGSRAISMPHILQRMHRDGDEIGDHSWNHPDVALLKKAQVKFQIDKTQAAVKAAGVPAPIVFRPPYGDISPVMKRQIHIPFIMWNDDTQDWANRNPHKTLHIAISEASSGGIVEMHDIYESTVKALPALIKNLKPRYHLVTVSQLLSLNSNSRGTYYDR